MRHLDISNKGKTDPGVEKSPETPEAEAKHSPGDLENRENRVEESPGNSKIVPGCSSLELRAVKNEMEILKRKFLD